MVTEFGKTLRKERVEREWTLNFMAESLGVSAAYLSHMEMGRRPVPDEVLKKICGILSYHEVKAARLKKLAQEAYSPEIIKIHSKGLKDDERDLAKMFARRFTNLDADEKNRMFELLNGGETDKDE